MLPLRSNNIITSNLPSVARLETLNWMNSAFAHEERAGFANFDPFLQFRSRIRQFDLLGVGEFEFRVKIRPRVVLIQREQFDSLRRPNVLRLFGPTATPEAANRDEAKNQQFCQAATALVL